MQCVAFIPVDPKAAAGDVAAARAILDAHGLPSLVPAGAHREERAWLDPAWLVTDDAAWIAAASEGTRTIVVHGGPLRSDHDPDFTAPTFEAAARRILRAEGLDGAPRWIAVGAAHLAALPHALDMPEHRTLVESVARDIAGRNGVSVVDLEVDASGVTVRVHGNDLLAVGLLTELRRSTGEWADSRGVGPFWRE